MLKSCRADVVHIREFIMLACACTCVPLTHAPNTSVLLILPPLPTPPKVVLRKSFKLKKNMFTDIFRNRNRCQELEFGDQQIFFLVAA
jgi:hypothetical protein